MDAPGLHTRACTTHQFVIILTQPLASSFAQSFLSVTLLIVRAQQFRLCSTPIQSTNFTSRVNVGHLSRTMKNFSALLWSIHLVLLGLSVSATATTGTGVHEWRTYVSSNPGKSIHGFQRRQEEEIPEVDDKGPSTEDILNFANPEICRWWFHSCKQSGHLMASGY